MTSRPLVRGLTATNVRETLENYGRADDPLTGTGESATTTGNFSNHRTVYDDGDFWTPLLGEANRELRWDGLVTVYGAVVSEWIARIPGLYWAPGAAAMRRVSESLVEARSDRYLTYRPPGKSQKVLGGIGTLKLPPDQHGYRLVTLTTTLNASAGIPALVSPENWHGLGLLEGTVLRRVNARWSGMDVRWAEHFPSVHGIPRGYLVLENTQDLDVERCDAPIEIHPFSVMRYDDGDAELFDYVYATVDTSTPGYSGKCARFFESYRKSGGRHGSYLLAADVANPMWDAVYSSPSALRLAHHGELRFLEERIDRIAQGNDVATELVRSLATMGSDSDLRRLSVDAGVPTTWYGRGTIAELSRKLVAAALDCNRFMALLQETAIERPQLFSSL